MRDSYFAFTSRFIVRDFVYSEDLVEHQKEELATADTTEKELWVRLDIRVNQPQCLNGAF